MSTKTQAGNVVNMNKELREVKIKTEAQFKQSLTKARESQQAAWQSIQDCIEFGIVKYLTASGDTSYLTRSIQLAFQMEAVDAGLLKGYIIAHCNVVLVKDNLGQYMFKKAMKGRPFGDLPEADYNWWDYKDEAVEQAPRADLMDIVAEIKKLQQRAARKLKEHKIPAVHAELVEKFIAGDMSLTEVKCMEPLPKDKLFSDRTTDEGNVAQPKDQAGDSAEAAQKPGRNRKAANA